MSPHMVNCTVSNVLSNVMNNKNKIWKDVRTQVDHLTDRLGMPVDQDIKSVVVGLNVNGINTVSSCGGHIDSDRLAFPWIGCAASSQPQFRFENEEKIKESIAQRYNIKPENIFDTSNPAAEKDYYDMTRNILETTEYAEWDKKNASLEKMVIECINEFYSQRKDSPTVRIAPGLIYPGCMIEIPDENEKKWRETLSENELKDKIREAQKEMEQFGAFLKAEFLHKS